jgi:hypothetical protein
MASETDLQCAQRHFCETMQMLRVVEGPDDRLARKFRIHWQGDLRERMEQWDAKELTSPLTKRPLEPDAMDDPYATIKALQARIEEWRERALTAERKLAALVKVAQQPTYPTHEEIKAQLVKERAKEMRTAHVPASLLHMPLDDSVAQQPTDGGDGDGE